MKAGHIDSGFSLVEILIALFIVSLTATNISVLQKLVCDQSSENFHHATVITLVSEKFEEIMQYDDVQNIDDLNGTSSTHEERGTSFALSWSVTSIAGVLPTVPVRDISITVTWLDVTGAEQTFNSNIIYYASLGR